MLFEYVRFLILILIAAALGAFSAPILEVIRSMFRGASTPRDRFERERPELHLPAPLEPLALPLASDGDSSYFRNAVTTLTNVRQMRDPRVPSVIGALRRMNAYAFEELVAICMAERGLEGQTSAGYSHDGGMDVLGFHEGRAVVVQAKRWRRHVSAHDVDALARLADSVAGIGLFVHTGRTGRASWEAACRRNVNLLSGGLLVDFVLGRAVTLYWAVPSAPSDPTPLPGYVQSAIALAKYVPAKV